ncbi:MAG: hypothetical protein ACR2IF_11385 [Terriglobales bacterium]
MKSCLVLLLGAAVAISAAAQSSHTKPSAAHARTSHAAASQTSPAMSPMPTAQAEALRKEADNTDAATPPPALPAPAAAPLTEVVAAAPPANVALAALPVGTAVWMKLETQLSTRANKAGDRFSGRVTRDVTLNGKTVIPTGAALEGRVARVDEPRRIKGLPTIDLRPEFVTLPNGNRLVLSAVVVDTSARPATSVNDEGRIKGRGHDGSDWKETGIGAGAGAATGALVAGGTGALVGAGVGATASVVHWLIKRRSADLPAGTEIIMEISRPMTLAADTPGN